MKTLLNHLRACVRRGSFKLKGGTISDYYLDIRTLFGDPKKLRLIGRAMAALLPLDATCIAASGYGGISIGTIVSQISGLPLCLVRTEKKAHGLDTVIIGYQPNSRDRIVIVDDVCTSGTSIFQTKQLLQGCKPKRITALVLVQRGNPTGSIKLERVFSIDEIID